MQKRKLYIYIVVAVFLIGVIVLYQRSMPQDLQRIEISEASVATKIDPRTNEIIEKAQFIECDDDKIYACLRLLNQSENTELTAKLFLLETDEGYLTNQEIMEKSEDLALGIPQNIVFDFEKPNNKWIGGRYYIIFYAGNEPIATIPFEARLE